MWLRRVFKLTKLNLINFELFNKGEMIINLNISIFNK